MEELRAHQGREIKPQEILLVVDAMTGQDAVNVAKTFNEQAGHRRRDPHQAGRRHPRRRGPVRASAVTGKPIKFSGTGEKLTDIEPFYPDRMASRILGMGDVLTLIEKAQRSLR